MAAPHVMIAEARFYTEIADELARGAIGVLEAAGATFDRYEVAGAFELPAAIRMAMDAKTGYDGYIALGCVIRGETTHYDYVCAESARGLQDLATRHGLAIGYGVLTVENEEQAWARAGNNRKNKGRDVANACLGMIELRRKLRGES
jgi:6,7-dimethyl-8-ribityllumazine synthase